NFGILPITFANEEDYELIEAEDTLQFNNVRQAIQADEPFEVTLKKSGDTILVSHSLTRRHKDIMLAGGIINWVKQRQYDMHSFSQSRFLLWLFFSGVRHSHCFA